MAARRRAVFNQSPSTLRRHLRAGEVVKESLNPTVRNSAVTDWAMPEENGRLVTFSVNVSHPFTQLLDDCSSVYVIGDHSLIGDWVPVAAVRMQKAEGDGNKASTLWTQTLSLPTDEIVNELQYRYFIGHLASNGSSPIVRVVKWESAAKPRLVKLDGENKPKCDEFGKINDRVLVMDGWLSESGLVEVRFSLFNRSAIQFNESKYSECSAYKVSVQALQRKQGNDELTVDKYTLISSAVINDEKRRTYRRSPNEKMCTEVYAADGHDLLSFGVQTSDVIEGLFYRFYVSDHQKESFVAVADVKPLSRSSTQGSVFVALVDLEQGIVIGKLNVSYLFILPSTPSVVKFCTMEISYVNYWTMRPSLDIGHRGMGKSYTHVAKERENTLKSMVTAFNKGADFAEFDVQLSKDEVPVLFHDFHVCLENEKRELREVPFNQLTLNQLETLNIRHHHDLKKPDKRSTLPVVDRKSEIEDPSCRAFPTLKDVFDYAPPHLGFNIEVKYPMYTEDGEFECEGVLEPNAFVDRILEVIAENAKGRRIVFSSFCPEMCTALKLKQNRYPAFFLTQGVTNRYVPYSNPLTQTSENAIAFAMSESLLGVCFHSEDVLRIPGLIQKARGSGLVSFVWGDDLDETKNIAYMRQLGVDGVIYDRIDEHTPGKRNVFQISKGT